MHLGRLRRGIFQLRKMLSCQIGVTQECLGIPQLRLQLEGGSELLRGALIIVRLIGNHPEIGVSGGVRRVETQNLTKLLRCNVVLFGL
jgi:hypothetical protein